MYLFPSTNGSVEVQWSHIQFLRAKEEGNGTNIC